MGLPIDWPRINQFPEWYTVEPGEQYTIYNVSSARRTSRTGEELHDGLEISLEGGEQQRLVVLE
jgi:hypothetical protein